MNKMLSLNVFDNNECVDGRANYLQRLSGLNAAARRANTLLLRSLAPTSIFIVQK